MQPHELSDEPRLEEGSLELPSLQIEVTPEKLGRSDRKPDELDEGFGRDLNDLRFDKLYQKLEEKKDLHKLRKAHVKRLFWLTFIWILSIWAVVLLQGFGQWFTPLFTSHRLLPFNLSDTVLIAFMTTTTTAVLGLYGIAAYWLYGNGNGVRKKPRKKKQRKPARQL